MSKRKRKGLTRRLVDALEAADDLAREVNNHFVHFEDSRGVRDFLFTYNDKRVKVHVLKVIE